MEVQTDHDPLQTGDLKLEFKYDYMGRRVEKKVSTYESEQWNLTACRRFVYADWLPLLELEVTNLGGLMETITVLRKYTWGLDLSGTFQDAGGIGGLLATRDVSDPNSPESYVYLYDANGNVGQLIDLSDGSIDAKYEYDPYGGNLLDPDDPNESGPYAAENPFRFSTKYFDAETALGYWGYRYCSPRLGRWLSRDPLGEPGAVTLARAARDRFAQPGPSQLPRRPNAFVYIGNAPPLRVDPLGQRECCKCGPDITGAIVHHLNRFISQRPGDLSWWLPSGVGVLEPIARGNGSVFTDAFQRLAAASDCGKGPCAGTVTLCDLCMSGYHIDHILMLGYIAASYGARTAMDAGLWQEGFLAWISGGHLRIGDQSYVDILFNELAICLALKMKHADDNEGMTDYLTVAEVCECTAGASDMWRRVIARKPGKGGGGRIGYDKCIPCDVSMLPLGDRLQLPPVDP